MSDTPGPTGIAPPLPTPPLPIPHAVAVPRPRAQVRSLTPSALAWLGVAAIAGDLGLRSGLGALSSTVTIAVVAGPILGSLNRDSANRDTTRTRMFIVLAMGFGVWLPMRASTWLTSLNAAAVVACLIAAAVAQRPAEWRWSTATVSLVRARSFLAPLFGVVFAKSATPLRSARLGRLAPIGRGMLIASVPVAILTALLASADAVFAQSIAIDVDPSSSIGHLALTMVVAAAIAGLVAMTGVPGNEAFDERRPLGAIETIVLLGAVGGLYAAFAFVQLVSALGGSDQILQQQGLSYAEYARGGFFQLLWVAGLTAILLGAVRLLTAEATPRLDRVVRLIGACVALLTTVIVAVAIVRLGFYTDEFGQTTLRWCCTAFAWMLGAAFVAIAAGHSDYGQRLLPKVLLGLVVGTLFAVNVLNPEARVAEHNLARADAVERLDADYLTRLSADAWPALLQHELLMTSRLNDVTTLRDQCDIADTANGYGLAGFNLALQRLDCR